MPRPYNKSRYQERNAKQLTIKRYGIHADITKEYNVPNTREQRLYKEHQFNFHSLR